MNNNINKNNNKNNNKMSKNLTNKQYRNLIRQLSNTNKIVKNLQHPHPQIQQVLQVQQTIPQTQNQFFKISGSQWVRDTAEFYQVSHILNLPKSTKDNQSEQQNSTDSTNDTNPTSNSTTKKNPSEKYSHSKLLFEQCTTDYNDIKLPLKATKDSAGWDFYAPYTITIPAQSGLNGNKGVLMHTGIKSQINENSFLALYVRSSIGIKKGLFLLNGTGIVDRDYFDNSGNEGHMGFYLGNYRDTDVVIEKGERVGQGVFMGYEKCVGENELFEGREEEVRKGGVGSTGG